MDTSIVTLDNKGRFKISDEDALVFNLYRTVYSLPIVDKQLYVERINNAGSLLTLIKLEMGMVEDLAILNLAWGVYKIGKIEGEEFEKFFKKESARLRNYEGHERVVEYVNTCLSTIHATFHFQITQEKMPASAYKTVEQIDKLSERIAEGEKEIVQMVKTAREAVKEMGERLDEAEKKLAEKDDELEKMRAEKERMNSEEFRKEVGREYILKVFEEYLEDADEMEEGLRKDWYNVLQGLCSIEAVPKEVKKMIRLLKRKPKSGGGMTVNTQTYVENQNNNYK